MIFKQPLSFHLTGISFKTCSLEVREKFSFTEKNIQTSLSFASANGLNNLLILSTCNRVEIFGFVPDKEILLSILFQNNNEFYKEESNFIYHKSGYEAVEHVFNVASGLDSQILGDFQIAGQLKNAHQYSINARMNSPELNRLVLSAIHCSRQVKNNTGISKGNASVASAAFSFIKSSIENYNAEKYLVIGAGKTAKVILQILSKEVPFENITVTNRTAASANNLAEEFRTNFKPFEQLSQIVKHHSIIITATAADKPIIDKEVLLKSNVASKLFIDLGVPRNIADDVYQVPGICVVNIDQLKDSCNQTLLQREQSVPLAKITVHDAIEDFILWLAKRARYSKGKINTVVSENFLV